MIIERSYTRETQKLIYWLFSDFANYEFGNEVGSTPSEYQMYKIKQVLKKDYIKATGVKLPREPLESFLNELKDKDNKSIEELQDGFIYTLKAFLLLNNEFSLSLNMLSQKKANRLVKYLFDKALDLNIPLRKEITELYKEQQQKNYIFTMLLKKKCVVCGRENVDLDHWDNASEIGGYKFDD